MKIFILYQIVQRPMTHHFHGPSGIVLPGDNGKRYPRSFHRQRFHKGKSHHTGQAQIHQHQVRLPRQQQSPDLPGRGGGVYAVPYPQHLTLDQPQEDQVIIDQEKVHGLRG